MSSIKDFRVSERYTQKQFAELIGMNYHTYVKKERGDVPFTAPELHKIKEVFPQLDMNKVILNGGMANE